MTKTESEYEVKVTRIKNRYHARLLKNKVVLSEMACELRIDIGYICRQLLRWEDKSGGDKYTSASRKRLSSKEINHRGPVGKVWYNLDK